MDKLRIDIRNLNKTFSISGRKLSFTERLKNKLANKTKKVHAIKDINLQVKNGEFLGIIGKNGSGKSTLLKLIIGAMDPDEGSHIETHGKIIRLALGMGFDVDLTARDNIYLNGTILGLSFKQIGEKFEEIIAFAELEDFIDTPIKFYSSGMRSRLSFAIAIHAEADIFLIDEFFGSVGDLGFMEKSQKAFEENILQGKTIIHVSHSLELIRKHCTKILVMEKGSATIYDDVNEAIEKYGNVSVG